jgi:hypothetical protein
MRYVWGFGVGHTYSHPSHSMRRQSSSGTGDDLPATSPSSNQNAFTTTTGVTGELTGTGMSTAYLNSRIAVAELTANTEIHEVGDDSTWALSDQDDDNDDGSGSDLESIPSQDLDDIPDDL